ncbi:unnamed protein product [Strongylus vulgaris]|uniref:Uncharacterized protein n=1 Tax=Strongylus vulgaris TaxID=40348 RepID=A0A3P7LTE1_STRVU|nr:unnamed protein product [Strongylus vulgaris]
MFPSKMQLALSKILTCIVSISTSLYERESAELHPRVQFMLVLVLLRSIA